VHTHVIADLRLKHYKYGLYINENITLEKEEKLKESQRQERKNAKLAYGLNPQLLKVIKGLST
jgi:hypothetical protein